MARQPRQVAERVLLVDYVSDDERNAVLHGAAALAYPSLDEGFGFPALEAMAAGVPVVAADAGSLPEVCGRRRDPGRTRATHRPWRLRCTG